MTVQKLRTSQVASVLAQLVARQKGRCAICGEPFTKQDYPVLDHSHDTGYIRGACHNTCNSTEGYVKAKARRGHRGVSQYDFLIGLGKYLEKHKTPQIKLIHPTHMTENDKRELRNAKARAKRAVNKQNR